VALIMQFDSKRIKGTNPRGKEGNAGPRSRKPQRGKKGDQPKKEGKKRVARRFRSLTGRKSQDPAGPELSIVTGRKKKGSVAKKAHQLLKKQRLQKGMETGVMLSVAGRREEKESRGIPEPCKKRRPRSRRPHQGRTEKEGTYNRRGCLRRRAGCRYQGPSGSKENLSVLHEEPRPQKEKKARKKCLCGEEDKAPWTSKLCRCQGNQSN